MIKIIMKDGTVYENDPSIGWNLDRISDIKEVLERAGAYSIQTKLMTTHINIFKDDVKEIIDEENPV